MSARDVKLILPLTRLDLTVLVVAAVAVLAAFRGGTGVLIKPSWSHALEPDDELLPPPPVVADIDGDGVSEVFVAAADGRVLLLSPAVDRSTDAVNNRQGESPWRTLPTRRAASLRSNTGLATGRRPIALAAGAVVDGGGSTRRIVVALTEDWTVLAFDDKLHLLWEHSVGVGARRHHQSSSSSHGQRRAPPRLAGGGVEADEDVMYHEVALLVAPTPIYRGDVGVVLVGGHTERTLDAPPPPPGAAQPSMDGQQSGGASEGKLGGHNNAADGSAASTHAAGGSPQSPGAPSSLAPDAIRSSMHFSYHALDGGSGALRWSHRHKDFHKPLHGDEHFTPQMDYKLDLESLGGGGEASLDGRHEGEKPWRLFSESMMRLLPLSWRHPHDTSLSLGRFERQVRPSHQSRRKRAAGTGAAHGAGAHALGLTSRYLGTAASTSGLGNNGTGTASGGAASSLASTSTPNVVFSRRRHGIEVLHLYTGRTLTQLPLPSHASHADVNGDGTVDHVVGLSSHETHALIGEGHPHHHLHTTAAGGGGGKKGKNKNKDKRSREVITCLGTCSSGVPVHEELWNASVCNALVKSRPHHHGNKKRGSHGGGGVGRSTHGMTKPLLVKREPSLSGSGSSSPTYDSIFLASDGRVTSVQGDGSPNWHANTDALWRVVEGGQPASEMVLPSLTVYQPTDESVPLILAVGENALCVLTTAEGRLLNCVQLPHTPIAPPVLADFTGDGIADIIVQCETAYLGLRVSVGTGALLQKLLFAFLALAVSLVMAVKHGGEVFGLRDE